MKTVLMCGGLAATAGGLYWHGDLSGGELYNVPVADAYQQVSNMGVEPRIENLENSMINGGTISTDSFPDASVVKWHVTHNGDDIGTLVAAMRAAGANRTRITISYEAGTTDESKDRIKDARTFVRGVVQPLMAEQIDARMNHREFSQAAIKNVMTSYLLAHSDTMMREASSRMNEAAAKFREYDAENERSGQQAAYLKAQEDAGKPTLSTKPMTDTSRFNR